MLKNIIRFVLNLLFRVEVIGQENLQYIDKRAIIVANHQSFIDGVLLAIFIPDTLMFAINSHYAKKWYLKPFLAIIDIFPIEPSNPLALKHLISEIKKDKKCVIFPEGRITVTGSLMKIYEGPGFVADKTDAQIVPIRIEGAQYSKFSRLKGKVKTRWFPKITLHILKPQKLSIAPEIQGRTRRAIAGDELYKLMSDMLFKTSNNEKTLFSSLIEQKNLLGRNFEVIEDISRKKIGFGKLIAGSFLLGAKFSKFTAKKSYVGVFLPNSSANLISFFALQAFDRIPALLNFSNGVNNFASTCQTANIKTVITSHLFIEKAKFHGHIERLKELDIKVIYLEDIAKTISLFDKLLALVYSYFPKIVYSQISSSNYTDSAVVLFTSGSEGVPKGVVLSHYNIQSNMKQLSACIDFGPGDVVFNALPMFHSFGLVSATLLPLLSGIKVFLYPTPLHYRIIPELVYDTNATILFGTDTFLSGYAHYAHPYDFYSLRYVFAGAEKLKEDTRNKWSEKYGVRIFEGYGATEASPVISVNTPMYNKKTSVGRILPNIDYQITPVEGINLGGRLSITGPNIMLGYLLNNNPGVITPVIDNTYDTGDIVYIDDDGFVFIVGRAKRFAKIAGEMVSLTSAENDINKIYDKFNNVVINIPDAKKGEALVLVTDNQQASRSELIKLFKTNNISELTLPKQIMYLAKIPMLGTGKTDYVAIENYVKENIAPS